MSLAVILLLAMLLLLVVTSATARMARARRRCWRRTKRSRMLAAGPGSLQRTQLCYAPLHSASSGAGRIAMLGGGIVRKAGTRRRGPLRRKLSSAWIS